MLASNAEEGHYLRNTGREEDIYIMGLRIKKVNDYYDYDPILWPMSQLTSLVRSG